MSDVVKDRPEKLLETFGTGRHHYTRARDAHMSYGKDRRHLNTLYYKSTRNTTYIIPVYTCRCTV